MIEKKYIYHEVKRNKDKRHNVTLGEFHSDQST